MNLNSRSFYVSVILFCCMSTALIAQDNAPSFVVELDPEKAYLGDPVTYLVTFNAQPGWKLSSEPLSDKFGEATVLSQEWLEVQETAEAAAQQQFRAKFAFYELGDKEIGKYVFKAVGPEGQEIELFAPAMPITIEALLEESDQELALNKGQVGMKVPFFWLMLIGILIGVILLVLFAFYLRAKLNKPKPKMVIPPKPPFEEALDRLAKLTGGSLLKEGRVKEFYVEIHLIIRHYFHRLYGIPAEEMTRFEFEDWMQDHSSLPGETRTLCLAFGDLCDRVKFAKYDPVESETKDLVNHAYQIVEQLKPKPAAAHNQEVNNV